MALTSLATAVTGGNVVSAELYQKIIAAIVAGRKDQVLALTELAVRQGLEPIEIINKGFLPSLEIIGRAHESGMCFAPQMMIATVILQAGIQLLETEIKARSRRKRPLGRVVLGTVSGDIHTIGKNLVRATLTLGGFEVIDLGHNVPTPLFVKAVKVMKPPILGLSAFLRTTMPVQQEVITALSQAGLRQQVKVIIGGNSTSPQWAAEIGADGYAASAAQAIPLCQELLG
jgi:methanogenic corrinoid protein MtbC1